MVCLWSMASSSNGRLPHGLVCFGLGHAKVKLTCNRVINDDRFYGSPVFKEKRGLTLRQSPHAQNQDHWLWALPNRSLSIVKETENRRQSKVEVTVRNAPASQGFWKILSTGVYVFSTNDEREKNRTLRFGARRIVFDCSYVVRVLPWVRDLRALSIIDYSD